MSILLQQISPLRPSIQAVAPHPRVVGLGRIGAEVELENLPSAPKDMKYWELHHDGSLRNHGIEFVFREPLGGESIWLAINELVTTLRTREPDASWRTSTHIHVDVRDLTVKQLRNMILLYAGYESMLFKLHGEHRMTSIFCPAINFAKEQIRILSNLMNCPEEEFFRQPLGDKYSSMNVASIGQRGSIEFRGSEAKWQCVHLLRLINRLLTIRELSITLSDKSFDDIINLVITSPLRDIFHNSVPQSEPTLGWDRKASERLMRDIVGLYQLPLAHGTINYRKQSRHSSIEDALRRGITQMDDPFNAVISEAREATTQHQEEIRRVYLRTANHAAPRPRSIAEMADTRVVRNATSPRFIDSDMVEEDDAEIRRPEPEPEDDEDE